MLEGLEISEILFSDLLIDNWTHRLDSEFQKKEYTKNINLLKQSNFIRLKEAIKHMSGGATPLGAEYAEKGIPFLRVQNIMQNYFDLSNVVFLNEKQDREIERSRLKYEDVLLTITGVSYGKSATVNKELVNSNINQHSVKITLKKTLNPYFLSTFLNSKAGKLQSDKNIVGVTRPALDYKVIRNFVIPILSNEFQNSIEKLIKQSQKVVEKSQSLYTEAESLLLQEIGLKNFEPSKEGINVKSLKDSFLSSGRLDAEYYQPKYEEIVSKVKERNFDILSNLVTIKKSVEIGSANYAEEGIPFLRVADFSKQGLTEAQRYVAENYVKENKELVEKLKPKKGTILFSKDGSVGTAYHLRNDFAGITSGAILHLKVKDKKRILPEYLTLTLNSKIVQMQAERDAGGSIILHWRTDEIKNVVVPIIDYQIQTEISDLVEKSFSLKQKSEQLLASAKKAVEMAIEQDEETALQWIETQLSDLEKE